MPEKLQRVEVTCDLCGAVIDPNPLSMIFHLLQNHPLQFLSSEQAPEFFRHLSGHFESIGETVGLRVAEFFTKGKKK